MSKRLDMTGEVHGDLTVLGYSDTKNGRARWHVRCKCGNTLIVRGEYLRNFHTTSCGRCGSRGRCGSGLTEEQKEEMKKLDLVGKPFGDWTVVSSAGVNSDGHTLWLCHCSCGNVRVLRGGELNKPTGTRSCGHARNYSTNAMNEMNAKRDSLTGEVFDSFVVGAKTEKRMPGDKSAVYHVTCNRCQTESEMSARRLRTSRKLNRSLLCIGCIEKAKAEKFERVASGLTGLTRLTPEATREANVAMRKAVWRTAPSEIATKHCEDIVNESWLVLLQKPDVETLTLPQIGGLSYRIAQNIAKRHFDKQKMKFKEPLQNDDGDFEDIFEDLNTTYRDGIYSPQETSDPLKMMALDVLSSDEKQFMTNFIKPRSGFWPYAEKALYLSLVNKVKAMHQKLLAECEGNQTRMEECEPA